MSSQFRVDARIESGHDENGLNKLDRMLLK